MKKLRHKKRVLVNMSLRMRNKGLYKAWANWFANAKEIRRQLNLLEIFVLRMQNAVIYKACASEESVGENGPAYSKQGNVQGMGIVACECTGRAAAKGVAEEGGTSDAKEGIVQSIGLVEFDCT